MDFVKHNFKGGEKLFATQLNAIEDAIVQIIDDMKEFQDLFVATDDEFNDDIKNW